MLKYLLIILTITFSSFSATPLCVYKDMKGTWNFIDSDGEIFKKRTDILKYGGYREGRHRVIMDIDGEQKWAFLDEKGEFLFSLEYDDVKDYYDGVAMVSNDSRDADFPKIYGYIDREGNEIVAPKYKDALVFQEGLTYVMNDEERGYINTDGEFEIKFQDTLVGYRFSEGLAAVSNSSFKHGIMNREGELLTEFIYDEPSYFSEGLARANYKGEVGLIDTLGNIIIPFDYFEIKEFSEGRSFAAIPGKGMSFRWALIDRKGNFLTDHIFNYVNDFNQGLAAVKHIKKGWMYITKDGEEYLDNTFRYINNFAGEEELAWASKLVNYDYYVSGFIDKTGEFVIPIEDYVFAFDLRLNKLLH